MDPLTQTLLGAVAAQAVLGRKLGRTAALLGAVGGELPDIDVFFPWADAALPIEFHRHFTHSLAFVPVGGVIAALPFLLVGRWRHNWKLLIAAATIGCATHGLLDTCTSYGTYLLWPFVNERLAWDLISIIDPLFTVVLVTGLVWSLIAKSARPARVALLMCLLYLGVGLVQHARAAAVQEQLASQRGHEITRGRVMPTLGNLLLWRSVYEAEGMLYADAVRAPLFQSTMVRQGSSLSLARFADLPQEVRESQRIQRVFGGFVKFADGYVAHLPDDPRVIADMRYSLSPAGFEPLWGIEIESAEPNPTVRWIYLGADRNSALRDLWQDLLDGSDYRLVPTGESGSTR
ncbi:MAG: metal-dependent hydrolase [Planctomycetes bacterium]|nr:metal-dependent hydrolase [Planctomycetota bacterium]